MVKVVIIGGGWGGCAAALTARKAGAEVVLLERTDMLLGCGLVGGIMRNNGRYTAAEELNYLGGGELIEITDSAARHVNINLPGHNHASLYDTTMVEPMAKEMLEKIGVNLCRITRAVDVVMESKKKIKGIVLSDDTVVEGDVFIEATGSAGPMGNCLKYGNGCSMCILRCPSFGPRISISSRAGVEDIVGMRGDEMYGAFSGSCELNKDSLSEEIKKKLKKEGVVILPVPEEDINVEKLEMKACQQYALPEYAKNVIILDTGRAKLMMSFYPLEKLRKIPGLERAVYEYSDGEANSVRYLSRAPRDNAMKVTGLDNLLCAGEKSGLFVGHTEAMVTGCLAGHNSVRLVLGMPLLELPINLASGDLIAYENECIKTKEGLKNRYTFAGGIYFERMKELNLYTTDSEIVKERVCGDNLENVYEGV
ncbi:MAG: FAD-dependent oxidoreductase [Candidatus Methanofastidiosia archaeon]